MDKAITERLYSAMNTLNNYVSSGNSLCSFGSNGSDYSTLNYSDLINQLVYLLKYYPAHMVEYFLCYKQIMSIAAPSSRLKIVSISNGLGLDYEALSVAAQESGLSWRYLSIDPFQWCKKPEDPRLEFKNIGFDRIDGKWLLDKNVFSFPKTFSIIKPSEMVILKAVISQVQFKEPKMALINSCLRHAASKINELVSIFLEKGYVVKARCNLDHFDGFSIRSIIDENVNGKWSYPASVLDQLAELPSLCPNFSDCRKTCTHSDVFPVTHFNAEEMFNEIIYLEK